MPVEAACPSCEGKFRLPDAAAGKKIRCPKCKGPLEVPPLSSEAKPATVAALPVTAPVPTTPSVSTPTTPTPNDNLKSTWRSASPEPAPVEQPRKEAPRIETPKPQLVTPPTATPAKPAATTANPKPSSASLEAPRKTASPTTPVFVAPATIPPAPTSAPKPKPPESAPVAPQTASAEQWFLKGEDGETFGPVDRSTLDNWHDEGRMTADSQLLQHGTEQWQWASDVYPDLEEPEPEPAAPIAATSSSIHQAAATTTADNSVSRNSKVTRAVTPVEEDEDHEDVRLSPHSKPVAFLLGLTLGMFGIHRFYLGYVGIGLAMFFTFGGLLMWSITDSLRILFGHVTDSEGLKLRD